MPLTSRRNERGAALVAALCVLLTVSMLAASAVALSKASAEGLALSSGRVESWYAAESCASRAQWMLMRELELNPDREIGKKPDPRLRQAKSERLFADNVLHRLELYGSEAECRIRDMASGLDATAAASSIRMLFRDFGPGRDAQVQGDAETLAMRIEDYVDTDDFIRKDGLERSDYDAAGLQGLPRNGLIRFREELALIPGFAALFPDPENGILDIFRPIAPLNLQQSIGRPAFMSAPPLLLEKHCRLNAKELDATLRAREQWQSQGTPLSESLDPSLQQKLRSTFGFSESGFYTLETTGRSGGAAPGSLIVSMRIERNPSGKSLAYYDWLQY